MDVFLGSLSGGASGVLPSMRPGAPTVQSTGTNQSDQTDTTSATKKRLQQLTSEANKALQPVQTRLHYVFYDKLDRYYVQVINVRTHEVIREIPPKKELDFYAAVMQEMGLMLNRHV